MRSSPGTGEPDASPSKKRQKVSRGKGLRTRTGCASCRARRVKCNEEKPSCRACRKRGQQCSYPIENDGLSAGAATSGSTRDSDLNGFENQAESTRKSHVAQDEQQSPSAANHETQQDAFYDASGQGPVSTDLSVPNADAGPASYEGEGANLPDFHSEINGTFTFGESPESSWSNAPSYSAEAASLAWFGLLANDANAAQVTIPSLLTGSDNLRDSSTLGSLLPVTSTSLQPGTTVPGVYAGQAIAPLQDDEIRLFQHFVQHLSKWIDVTDPDDSFAVIVSQTALENHGVMRAILALSARHLALGAASDPSSPNGASSSTRAVHYYHRTLQYLQEAMQDTAYLVSDELLATVLIISTYEMLDGHGGDWERHLKGVFLIQRSQLIHGESEGLKKWIWWAWLRQDIWAAFKGRRRIHSFYTLKKSCSDLNFHELVNRAVWLLGQCVNYTSDKDYKEGELDLQGRVKRGQELWTSLEEWSTHFSRYDRRLPTISHDSFPFETVWINPAKAAMAVQVHHFAKLLVLEYMPATGGLKELTARNMQVRESASVMCGIAYCTTEPAAMITSIQCLFAARMHLTSPTERNAIDNLMLSHQAQTGWPNHDIQCEIRSSTGASG